MATDKGRILVGPPADQRLKAGDRMLVLGNEKDHASMKLLSDHATPPEPVGVEG